VNPFPGLPDSVRVIVRGWLNCNQVVLRAPGANVLVDSGYVSHRERTLALVEAALEGEPLARLINTHCHSDHMGGNAAIARRYGARITIPAGEVKHVLPWTPQSVWMEQFDQRAEEFAFHDTIAAGNHFDGGGLEWQAIAAPGHDMDALMFFNARHRILVSGDALWENGMGFVWPEQGSHPHIDAALATLSVIEALDPALVIPGHGAPFAEVAKALSVAASRLQAFSADPAKNARHVAKALFVFSLLDKGRMKVEDFPAYVGRIAYFGELDAQFFHAPPGARGDWLLQDLVRSGAVAIEGGSLRATAAP
jgi:glyoxylase-like metal-dependent hydrolase (beta-lactamase superfamily II)